MKKITFLVTAFLFSLNSMSQTINKADPKKAVEISYTMPEESEPHEGTWLQWPHEYQYGIPYSNKLHRTWVDMTSALVGSEKVHIIAYNQQEKEKIKKMLIAANVSLTNVDFYVYPTDDVWVRDNGPIFAKDKNGKLVIQDWGFNGWGKKAKFNNCNAIPSKIALEKNIENIDLNAVMINEGGAFEIDGNGTFLATKSAILNPNRNPKMTQSQAEKIFTKYLGVTNFIWLDGVRGLEITDMHIDGFARFGNSSTLVTMSEHDLLDWGVRKDDIDLLFNFKNVNGTLYKIVRLPLTKENVVTDYGKKLGYRGSYINYYIANTVVLVPNYNDPNDEIANTTIQRLYPNRKVIGIDIRNLYANGGMIHCVTQQQPVGIIPQPVIPEPAPPAPKAQPKTKKKK